jgi:hypothetical protein
MRFAIKLLMVFIAGFATVVLVAALLLNDPPVTASSVCEPPTVGNQICP